MKLELIVTFFIFVKKTMKMNKKIEKLTPEIRAKMVEIAQNSPFLQEKLEEVKLILSKVKTA